MTPTTRPTVTSAPAGGLDRLANPFRPAENVTPHVKLLVYGAPGVGKTYLALSAPGPIAVVDTEGGTVHYAGRSGLARFEVLQTKTYRDVRAAVAYLRAQPEAYRTLVIDPVTVLYDVLQEAAQLKRAARKGDELADLEMLDWGQIKRFYRALLSDVINLPLHVVVTAREKERGEKRGAEFVRTGLTFDAEKGTGYSFDTVLHLIAEGGRRSAVVEKDRAAGMALGAVHPEPTFGGLFARYLKGKGTAERTLEDEATAAAATALVLPGGRTAEIAGPALGAELAAAIGAAGQDPAAILAAKGWSAYAELPRATAESLLARAA